MPRHIGAAFFTSAFVWQLAEIAKREVTLALALRLQKYQNLHCFFFLHPSIAFKWNQRQFVAYYTCFAQVPAFIPRVMFFRSAWEPGWAVNHPQQEQLPNQTKIPTELFFLFQHTKRLSHKCSLPLSRTQAIQYPQLSLSTSHSVSCLPFYTKQLVPAD